MVFASNAPIQSLAVYTGLQLHSRTRAISPRPRLLKGCQLAYADSHAPRNCRLTLSSSKPTKEKLMNNILRDDALRLALYLSRLGIDPHVTGTSYREYLAQLASRYCSVPASLRRAARREGRKVIRETGGVEPAAAHLLPEPSLPQEITGPWKKGYENHLKRILSWGPETPPCLDCRIGGVLPKRSWPSREMAEESRLLQNDPRLNSYPCPYQPGYWHLGHRGRSAARSAPSGEIQEGPRSLEAG